MWLFYKAKKQVGESKIDQSVIKDVKSCGNVDFDINKIFVVSDNFSSIHHFRQALK
jgi:hypothetical protein